MSTEGDAAAGVGAGSDRVTEDAGGPGWTTPEPESVPRPTAAPAALALGLTLLAFGALTSWIISAMGAVVAVGASGRWITEMHHAADS